MNDEVNSIGEYLKSVRKQNKITIAKLSVASGVSPTFISQVENSQRNPSPEVLRKLADALEDVDYIHLMQLAGYIGDKEKLQQEILKLKSDIDHCNYMIQIRDTELLNAEDFQDSKKVEDTRKSLIYWKNKLVEAETELNFKTLKLTSSEKKPNNNMNIEQNIPLNNGPTIITLDSNNEGDFLFANEDGILSHEIQNKIKSMIKILLD